MWLKWEKAEAMLEASRCMMISRLRKAVKCKEREGRIGRNGLYFFSSS